MNNASIKEIEDLLTKDHVFIDSGGEEHHRKENMKQVWIDYFKLFPDYHIDNGPH